MREPWMRMTVGLSIFAAWAVVVACESRGDGRRQPAQEGTLAGSATENGLRLSLHLVEGVLVGEVVGQRFVAEGLSFDYHEDRVLYDAVETTVRVEEEWRGTVRTREVVIVDAGSDVGRYAGDPTRRQVHALALPHPRLPGPGERVVVLYGRRPSAVGLYATSSMFTVLAFRLDQPDVVELPEDRGGMSLDRLHEWMEETL